MLLEYFAAYIQIHRAKANSIMRQNDTIRPMLPHETAPFMQLFSTGFKISRFGLNLDFLSFKKM